MGSPWSVINDHSFMVEGRNDCRMTFPLAGNLVDHDEGLGLDDTVDRYRMIKW